MLFSKEKNVKAQQQTNEEQHIEKWQKKGKTKYILYKHHSKNNLGYLNKNYAMLISLPMLYSGRSSPSAVSVINATQHSIYDDKNLLLQFLFSAILKCI